MMYSLQTCCYASLLWFLLLAVYTPSIAQSGAVLAHNIRSVDKSVNQSDQQAQQLVQVLDQLEKVYDIRFAFQAADVENKLVKANATFLETTQLPLEKVLQKVLDPLDLTFKRSQVDDYYIIRKKNEQIKLVNKLQSVVPDNSVATGMTTRSMVPTLQPSYINTIDKTITGTVTDLLTGEGLPGVNIVVKGTTVGTVTDINGNYRLTAPDDAETLVFSSVGYTREEVPIGNQTVINLSMAPDIQALQEVVVTAFGVAKEKKSLVYATQEVQGEDLAKAGNNTLLGGLQGKVAGATVNLNSGMPGKAPTIRIRGSRSLSGNNQPLYVIDGLPVSGEQRMIDFNPNDIESLNILKGPAASALYGLRASNGVVVITTKNGSGSSKPTVTFNTFYSVDQIGMLPDLQMEFAQGVDGNFDPNSIFTWGPRISTMSTYTNQLGEQEEPAVYDNDKSFFQTGGTWNSNLTFANSGAFGNFLIGVGRTQQQGIVPNSGMNRTNVKVNGELKLSKNFTAGISVNYSDLNIDDFPELGGNSNIFRGLTETPPSYNLAGKPFARPDDPYYQIFYRVSQNNPYWYINNSFRDETTKRTFGNVFLKYDFTESLSLNYRLGIDHYSTGITNYDELGSATAGRSDPPSGGRINFFNSFSDKVNSNIFLTYNKTFGEDWSLDVIAGNEFFDTRLEWVSTTGSELTVGDWPNLSNGSQLRNDNFETQQRIVGFYGNVNLGWQDKVFLNASGRNDIVSNMPEGNRFFFYPSVGVSGIITEFIPASQAVFSFAKIRATVAEVGQAGPRFVQNRGFNQTNPGGFVFPYQGLVSWSQDNTRISPDLEPENTVTFELGGDFSFLNDRIGIDYTYYESTSEGQIFRVPVPITTGANNEIRNGGNLTTRGHEIILSLVPVQTAAFRWTLNANFSTFKNEVGELYGGTERVGISGSDIITLVAQVGSPYPAFIGSSYLRDEASGQIIYQSNEARNDYGLPLINRTNTVIGTPTPDFEMNFTNNLSYQGLSLSFQIDWRQGGYIYSQSLTESYRRGLAGDTRDRETQFVPVGKKGTVSGGELTLEGDNDITINKDRRYFDILRQVNEAGLTDASFVRLREVTLNYNLPTTLLSSTFIREASVYFTGRNLFLITDSFYDPEVNVTEGPFDDSNSQGIELSQIPQNKSYGAGIRLTF